MIERIPVTSARSLPEAYSVLADRPRGLRVLAGGTDLMVAVNARAGLERIGQVLDIWKLPELRGIHRDGGMLRIGALTTYTGLIHSPLVLEALPALAQVSREVGAVAIQNRGTLGGNVCNASPAGDTLPILLAAEARFVLGGPRGERTVSARDFFTGYRKTALGADELLLRVDVPDVRAVLLENPYPSGPFGAKGVGELPMDVPAPAVAAAVLHATGKLVPELPISPERLMRALAGDA